MTSASKNEPAQQRDFHPVTEEDFAKAIAVHKAIDEGDIEHIDLSFLPSDIRESWTRCLAKGIPHSADAIDLQQQRIQEMPRKSAASIPFEAFNEIFNTIFTADEDHLYLSIQDTDGSVYYLNRGTKAFGDIRLERATLYEDIVGTTAKSLAFRSGEPSIVQGPQHFNRALLELVSCAAPIRNHKGEMVAVLSASRGYTGDLWRSSRQMLARETFRMVSSLAIAFSEYISLLDSTNSLRLSSQRLETTLSMLGESVLTVDANCRILDMNEPARKFLKVDGRTLDRPLHLEDFSLQTSSLTRYIPLGQEAEEECVLLIDGKEIPCFFDTRPIIDTETGQPNGAVVRLFLIKDMNAMTALRSGNVAFFTFDHLVGTSDKWAKAVEAARKASSVNHNVLLIGERGVGKEVIAQAIHSEASGDAPFVIIDFETISPDNIRRELFGEIRPDGRTYPGKLSFSNSGTLFLHRIEAAPIGVQNAILQTIKNGMSRQSLGSLQPIHTRVIATANKDPEQLIQSHQLSLKFYSLFQTVIDLPPLRKRGKDIEALTQYFLQKFCAAVDEPLPIVLPEAMQAIKKYDWPGNIRQLQQAVMTAVKSSPSGVITLDSLPPQVVSDVETPTRFQGRIPTLKESEKDLIERTLALTNDNAKISADLLGVSKSTLYRKIREYGIDFPFFR